MTLIVAAASPFHGHVQPVLTVASDLVRRRHEVVVLTGSRFAEDGVMSAGRTPHGRRLLRGGLRRPGRSPHRYPVRRGRRLGQSRRRPPPPRRAPAGHCRVPVRATALPRGRRPVQRGGDAASPRRHLPRRRRPRRGPHGLGTRGAAPYPHRPDGGRGDPYAPAGPRGRGARATDRRRLRGPRGPAPDYPGRHMSDSLLAAPEREKDRIVRRRYRAGADPPDDVTRTCSCAARPGSCVPVRTKGRKWPRRLCPGGT